LAALQEEGLLDLFGDNEGIVLEEKENPPDLLKDNEVPHP
jgi:hypothetical protein